MAIYDMYYLKGDYNKANSVSNASLLELKSQLKSISSKLSYYTMAANRTLEGQAYKIILGRLKVYSEAYNYLSEAIDVALNNMESGNNSVINAMGSFSEISGKKMQEIESEISRQKYLCSLMSSQTQNNNSDGENNNSDSVNDNRYAQIKQLESQKNELEEALMNTNSADTEGAGNLAGISSTLVNFEKCFTMNN